MKYSDDKKGKKSSMGREDKTAPWRRGGCGFHEVIAQGERKYPRLFSLVREKRGKKAAKNHTRSRPDVPTGHS